MISNLILGVFVAFLSCSSHINSVQTSRDIDLNRDPDPEDLFFGESDSNFQDSNNFRDSYSGNKRKKAEGVSSKAKKNKKPLKYRHMTKPLKINIDDERINLIRESEQQMVKQCAHYSYYWHDHSTLTKDEIRSLCLNGWLSAKPIFSIHIPGRLEPDCDGALVLGPSEPSSTRRKMVGYFQYAHELKNKAFLADMLRCNCAYADSNRITLAGSKQFFYMLKVTNEMYCILTIIGELESREAEIVSVYKP